MASDKDLKQVTPSADAEPAFRPLRPQGQMAIPVGGAASAGDIVTRPVGTMVARGELLVERWPDASAAPLAPAAGRIAGLGVARLSARVALPAILFRPDADSSLPSPMPEANSLSIANMLRQISEMSLPAFIERLRKHGVWADRWTTPDLLGQLRACIRKPIDTILCDALDEVPELLLHNRIAATFPFELTAGVLALGAITGAKRVSTVMPAYGDAKAWEAMRAASAETSHRLVAIADHYPQSHPSLLVHELTGRHSRSVKLPVDSGVMVIGAAIAVAIGRCLLFEEPMLDVPVGIQDRISNKTHWLSVPVGTYWPQVLAQVSPASARTEMRVGNPLREVRITSDSVVAGGDLAVTASPHERYVNPDPCIRCAWCIEGCPVGVHPAGLLEAAQQDDPYLAEHFGLDACVECGICSYVCPSNLPILAGIRTLRSTHKRRG